VDMLEQSQSSLMKKYFAQKARAEGALRLENGPSEPAKLCRTLRHNRAYQDLASAADKVVDSDAREAVVVEELRAAIAAVFERDDGRSEEDKAAKPLQWEGVTSEDLTCVIGDAPMSNEVFDAYVQLLRTLESDSLIATYGESKRMLRQTGNFVPVIPQYIREGFGKARRLLIPVKNKLRETHWMLFAITKSPRAIKLYNSTWYSDCQTANKGAVLYLRQLQQLLAVLDPGSAGYTYSERYVANLPFQICNRGCAYFVLEYMRHLATGYNLEACTLQSKGLQKKKFHVLRELCEKRLIPLASETKTFERKPGQGKVRDYRRRAGLTLVEFQSLAQAKRLLAQQS
jgi:hypothetical protein